MYSARYNKDKTNALHVHLFDMMERIRERHPNFYFGLRSTNNSNRMEEGFLFQGNKNYAFAPLVTEGSNTNRTNCVGLCIKTDGEEYRCYIEIVYDIYNDKHYYDAEIYNVLAEKLKCRRSWNFLKNKNRFVKYFLPTDSIDESIKKLEHFVKRNIQIFLSIPPEIGFGKDKFEEAIGKYRDKYVYDQRIAGSSELTISRELHNIAVESVSINSPRVGGNTHVDFVNDEAFNVHSAKGIYIDSSQGTSNKYTYIIGDNGCGKSTILNYLTNPEEYEAYYYDKETVVQQPPVIYFSPYAEDNTRNFDKRQTIINPHKHTTTGQFLRFLNTKRNYLTKLEEKLGKKFHSIVISKKKGYSSNYEDSVLDEDSAKTIEYEKQKKVTLSSRNSEQWIDFITHNKKALDITVYFTDMPKEGQKQSEMKPYPIGAMSAGEKMIITYISFLSRSLGKMSNGIIFLFDEPETSLHPKWQLEFPETLRQLAEEVYGITGSHFIIATHSPMIVMRSGYIKNSQVIKLYRDNERILHSDIIQDLNQFNLLNLLFSEFGFDYYPKAEHESALRALQQERSQRIDNVNQVEIVKQSTDLMRSIHDMYNEMKSKQE